MKKFFAVFSLAITVVFALAAMPVFAQTGPAATVNIMSHAFNPTDVTIPVGGRVVWNNMDAALHTVTSKPGEPSVWSSGDLSPNQSYDRVFSSPGTYNYQCDYHSWMTGRVVVQSTTGAPPVSTAPPPAATQQPVSGIPSTGGSAPPSDGASSAIGLLMLTAAFGALAAGAIGVRAWSRSKIR